jgi:hypothetical protein
MQARGDAYLEAGTTKWRRAKRRRGAPSLKINGLLFRNTSRRLRYYLSKAAKPLARFSQGYES